MRRARGIAATVLGVLVALAAGAPARAEFCITTGNCARYDQGQCVEYYQSCVSTSTPAPSYGAIAFGRKSKAWGYSFQWDSQAKAESVAMHNCAQHGSDCEVAVWFERKCGAVASGEGTAFFWGLGDSDGRARADAQNNCVKGGGKGCEVQVSQCSK